MTPLPLFCLTMSTLTLPILAQPFIIGHRGASGYEPENTLRSFQRALDMGVDMIELDVYRCASGEVVVIHDATLNRTTNGTGHVTQLPWHEIKKYDAGQGEHVPLLSQVFDLVNKRITINIELKDAQAVQPVAQLIHSYVNGKNWSYDNFIVSSFDHDALNEFRNYCPQVKIGAIFEKNTRRHIKRTQQAHAQFIVVHYTTVTKKLIMQAHACGLQVFAYTVNDRRMAKKLQKLHIDGIATNYPDILH